MPTRVIRPALSTYLIWGACCAAPLVIPFIIGLFIVPMSTLIDRITNLETLKMVAVIAFVYLLTYLYIHSHEIRIDEEQIVFKSLFGRTRTMPLSHIAHVGITWFVYETRKESKGPPVLFRVLPQEGSGSEQMTTNAMLFSEKDRECILEMFDGVEIRPW
jgi:hypothetical protein